MASILGVVTAALLLLIADVFLQAGSCFELTVLHTNDVHSHFDEMTASGSFCKDPVKNKCYGGVARRATAVRQARQRYGPNVVLLDAGDQFQGTVWFTVHRGAAEAHYMNMLGYDAMAIGNHEYDNGVAGLVPFLRNTTFPVLCSNVDTTDEPTMSGLVNKSTIIEVGGQRVGIVGYTTTETPQLSSPGHVIFENEVESVRAECDRLQSLGVDKIIAVGHAGIEVDRLVAAQVSSVDLVIGGHGHTFLYTGIPPAEEIAEGPYPVVVTQPSGKRVPVVQAYAFGKYLGIIHLTFDDHGEVTAWSGNPVLLNASIAQDAAVLEDMKGWRAAVDRLFVTVIGTTQYLLDGGSCRVEECTMGDLMVDAIVSFYRRQHSSLNDVQIVILNGGSVRSSIDPGNFTFGDIAQTFPFGNTIDVVELTGDVISSIFERSIEDFDPCRRHGKFLQVAGVRVTYDVAQPNGHRVRELLVRHADNTFRPISADTVYKVATNAYMVAGGDGYTMIAQSMLHHYKQSMLDTDILAEYVTRTSPLSIRTSDRIQFVTQPSHNCTLADTRTTSR